MDCSICSLPFPSRGQPTCASCARALVYQARLERVTDLVANESLQRNVHHVISPPAELTSLSLPAGPEVVDIAESGKKHAHDLVLRETQATRIRCSVIDQQLDLLKSQIERAARDRETRRLEMDRRRADIAKEKAELESRVPQLLDPLHTNIRRCHRRLEKVYARTVEGRIKLCQEMARLAGLQVRRRRMPDGEVVQDYTIGGIPIYDLQNLNTAPPDLVNASLANICRLLTTCCHYLSIRLPAEITPPHANYPNPTIFSLQSSYQGFQPPYPGTTTSSTSTTPSTATTSDQRSQPKPRLLHLDRPLVTLYKEDPTRYTLFLEGISLLAWNISWLTTSQGLEIPPTYPAISLLGKNLYTLFRRPTNPASVPTTTQNNNNHNNIFGHFSHAGTHLNLAAAEGTDVLRAWRASASGGGGASFTRFLDRVKQVLFLDMSGAEWEFISGDDFDVEREDERAVLVGGGNRLGSGAGAGAGDVKRAREGESAAADGEGDDGKGYLKVKSRA